MTATLPEPTVRVRPGWASPLFFANIGLWLAIYAPIQVLLPEQTELLDTAHKEVVFGLVTGAGAVVVVLGTVLFVVSTPDLPLPRDWPLARWRTVLAVDLTAPASGLRLGLGPTIF